MRRRPLQKLCLNIRCVVRVAVWHLYNWNIPSKAVGKKLILLSAVSPTYQQMNTHTPTHARTHANILWESVLSLGAAKSCQETLYPSLSTGREHLAYDIWRRMVLLEGGWCRRRPRMSSCVRKCACVSVLFRGMFWLTVSCLCFPLAVYCTYKMQS